jgi:Leucine-rich repeat (LRR) protein
MIDLCKGIPNNKIIDRAEFSNLEIFDCSNNKIFYVSNITINAIKNIKLFDLTNNNIAFPSGYNKLY